jgi:DNA-binding response OmpR family regulator
MGGKMGKRKYRILLVEDDPQLLKTTHDLLKTKGYKVTTADCGENAIEAMEKESFDLVITDLIMKKVTGLSVLKRAKEFDSNRTVMITTGSFDVRHAIEAIRLDVDDYLLKPYRVDELIKRVSHCLEKGSTNHNTCLSVA